MPASSSRLTSRSSDDEIGIREGQLLADARQRLIEAEARFDADDQQVERVGERQPDAMLTAAGLAREQHARKHVAERRRRQRRRAGSASRQAAS